MLGSTPKCKKIKFISHKKFCNNQGCTPADLLGRGGIEVGKAI